MAEPSDAELKDMIRRLIPKVDLQKTGIKAFIKLLSKECGGVDLKSRSDYIKEELSAAINEMESSEEESSSEEEEAPKKKRGAGKGLSVKKEISPELAEFLGQGKEMARTDIVKGLWDYIKEHNLQNPDNKREILLDSKMKAVFGCDKFTMFTMNKYVTAHVHPFKPVDLTSKSPARKARTSAASAGKKRKRGATADDKKKRKPKKPGLQPPYRLSDTMAAVVGKDILPRPQVVTALWNYIKKNDLQNPNDKREILCDDKLKAVMGGNKKVTMFNMNRYITEHLLEKLDKSAYTHEEEDEVEEDVESEDEDEEDDD
mmetsp:Transcript_15854/g.45793  ORF Transcript_15854/g.45793 Transcript_15854/m.45793 type:complete len:316 (+) Transcript_15854:385-1332(+)|eukprot:CAMPEP_0176023656 /NCGR_PEP_ID=MMETSP0120_2-20121206/11545_1 /TAXON_ID=160619 /ORGANISM="Kryptoperidinium foliaceum, Strain CCMP 1326" /LENGTH=315 /DNA_ID=CAMNT_0017356823 /DNA_START=347 /DNA_END=1294 /DNA_ORIENTATION=-